MTDHIEEEPLEAVIHDVAPEDASIEAENTSAEVSVTIFTKNQCPFCRQAENVFDSQGVPYVEINVEEDTEPREEFGGLTPMEHVIQNYGRSMPVVIVEGNVMNDHWVGSRPDKIIELVQTVSDAGLLIPEELRSSKMRDNH